MKASDKATAFTDTQKVKPMIKPITFDGVEHREMTEAEYAQWQADQAEAAANAAAKAEKAAQFQAVLDKLGLTQDEAQALLG